MLLALIGYLGTMAVALVALVAAWLVVIGPPPQREARQPSHAIGAVARTAVPEPSAQAVPSGTVPSGTWGPAVIHRADDGAAAADADKASAAAEQAAAEKAKQLKLARYRKRQEQLARQRQEQQEQNEQQDWQYAQPYSRSSPTVLGYDQDVARDRPPAAVFIPFDPRRY